MVIVAGLAESGEVEERRCLWPLVVNVGRGQNNNASGPWVSSMVPGAAPFTTVFCADVDDEVTSKLPVFWIPGAVFWFNRHQ